MDWGLIKNILCKVNDLLDAILEGRVYVANSEGCPTLLVEKKSGF